MPHGVVTADGTIGGMLLFVYVYSQMPLLVAHGEMHAKKIRKYHSMAGEDGSTVITGFLVD